MNYSVAMVSDRITTFSGAERVLLAMAQSLGASDVYTPFCTTDIGPQSRFSAVNIQASGIQRLPGIRRYSKYLLPLEPWLIEQFDVNDYDLVVSSSHAVAKGVITRPDQCHISMIYSPMRYAWDLQEQYLREMNASRGLKSLLIRRMLHRLRNWDALSANRPDSLMAISKFIGARIWSCWRRPSTVIYPPVDVTAIRLDENLRDDFYVTASRMVPYKRFDTIVKAFKQMPNKKLVVIGDGEDFKRIRRLAEGAANIEITGFLETEAMRSRIARAKAFLFAAIEDFGIAPLEAQAAGTPVIALGRGGACETILDGETGVLFPQQTVESLIDGVERFESIRGEITPQRCRDNAQRFSGERFHEEFTNHVHRCLEHHQRCLQTGHFSEFALC